MLWGYAQLETPYPLSHPPHTIFRICLHGRKRKSQNRIDPTRPDNIYRKLFLCARLRLCVQLFPLGGGGERCVCVYCGTMAWVWIVWFILYSSACYFRTRSGSACASASVCALIIWNGHKQNRPIDRKFESTPRVFALGEKGAGRGTLGCWFRFRLPSFSFCCLQLLHRALTWHNWN